MDINLNRSDSYRHRDLDSWGSWEITDCFREIVVNAGIPLVYIIVSICVLLKTYIKYKRKNRPLYEPLISGQINSSYGTINSEESSIENDADEDTGDKSEPTLSTSRNKFFDLSRLFLGVMMLVLFFFVGIVRWREYDENKREVYWIISSIIEVLVWMYASLLAFINLASQQRNRFHLRGHLDILYFITFVASIINIYAFYLQFGKNFTTDYTFGLRTLIISTILVIITITEPEDDPDGVLLKPNSEGRYLSPEVKCSLYEHFTFSWVNPLISKGFRKTLNENDIYELPDIAKSSNAFKVFHVHKQKSLVSSLFYTFKRDFFVQFLYSVIWSIGTIFAPPYFLREILLYVQNYPNNGDVTEVRAYFYVAGLFFGIVIPSLCFQQSLWIGRQLGIKTRAILVGEIYLKSLSRKDTTGVVDNEEAKDKTGKITNLMSVDAQKISELISYIFYIYSFPLQIIICLTLLYLLLGISALVGVLSIIITYPIPALINQRFETIHKRLMAATDKRMGVMNELLQAIRIIKFFAWEDQFHKKIMDARENELKEIKDRLMQWVYMENVWTCMPLVIMSSVFMTYTKLLGNELSATVAFTALALFNMLRHALDEGPSTIIAIIQARISVDRIEKFLNEPELTRQDGRPGSDDPEIGFKDASFQWPDGASSTDNLNNSSDIDPNLQNPLNKFTLFDLNIEFPVGKFSIICGPTGSGKTSLLMALLGELECLDGRVFLPRKVPSKKNLGGAPSGIAYVAQTAWLQNATIRDNILFGLPFDEDRYNKLLNVCALSKDLEIFEFGDKTEVGEKGITLSGGQKQRIALARAVYSQATIIIMDDCLSAVDAHTAKHLYEKCLMGDLMKDRTLILVTHHVGLCLRGAHKVIVIKGGRIVGQGTPSEIMSQKILEEVSLEKEEQKTNIESVAEEVNLKQKKIAGEGDGKLITEEERAEGIVDRKVYKIYFAASGGFLFWTFLMFMFIVTQFLQVLQDWWIREWTNAYTLVHDQIYNVASTLSSMIVSWSFTSSGQTIYNTLSSLPQLVTSFNTSMPLSDYDDYESLHLEQNENQVDVNYYLGVYVLIGLLTALLGSFRTYYMFMGSLAASRKLHKAILDKVLSAKIRFFDTTPIGRILNRFSKDMEVIDQNLSPMAMFLIYSCVATASVILAISAVMPQFLIAGTFIAALYIFIGAYYVATSRDLKRIESVKRSPIYAAFGETIVGVSTIRAFGAENKLMKKMLSLVDGNNRPFIFNWACNRWLNTRVDVVGGLVSLVTGAIVIYRLSKGMDPGLAGFALTYALNFTGHLLWVLRMYALQEMNMNSVERVREYMDLEEEPPRIIEGHRPPSDWPFKGEIKVNNLVMQYASDSPLVLKDVSFHVKPSEKVGIVGRTGSGKSTLALSFFRFMEPTSGQIIIDNIDISTLGLFDLRSRLTIIPQDPVLFSGTLRSNLDPFGEHKDIDLWNALRRAHLIDEENEPSSSSSQPSKNATPKLIEDETDKDKSNENLKQSQFNWSLDALVSENGNNFSQGQRQLIALARALVRRSRLIIMDEATASVDFKTDRMIQETIRQEFKDSTLLCIAHRIRTVVDYDKILVLDNGRIVEFDHPHLLIQNPDSVFRAMCEKSGEFTELVEIAKMKYAQ